MAIIWSAIYPKPCGECHLRPCYREAECPKVKKWARKLEELKAKEREARERDNIGAIVSVNGYRYDRNLKRRQKK